MHLLLFLFIWIFKTFSLPKLYHNLSKRSSLSLVDFRSFEKVTLHCSKLHHDIKFFKKCLELNICPKYLQPRLPKLNIFSVNSSSAKLIFSNAVKSQLKNVQSKYRQHIRKYKDLKLEIQSKLTYLEYIILISKMNRHVKFTSNEVVSKHNSKLTRLWLDQRRNVPDCVRNLSSVRLTPCELESLRYGLDRHIIPRNINSFQFRADIEKSFHSLKTKYPDIQQIGSSFKDKIRQSCATFLNSASSVCSNIQNRCFHRTLSCLRNNTSIKITAYDKGNGVVVLDSTDYISKLDSIVSDESKFEKLTIDDDNKNHPVVKTENKLIYYLNRYIRKLIPKSVYEFIVPSGSQPGKLYGLAKVHKPECPLRPIVSMIGTPEYNLAKYLDGFIKPNIPSKYMLASTSDFINVLDSHKSNMSTDDFIVSFDVESLFTNVPLTEVIEIAADCVYSSSSVNRPPFSIKHFKHLLKLATNGIFMFNNEYYKQIDGVAMGNPLGPTLANIFMAFHEEKWQNLPHSPVVYCRYVDDIFCIFRNNSDHTRFLSTLNEHHPNLKFTIESGNKQLPFLDVNVQFDDNSIHTTIFRKTSFTGLCLHFDSVCPIAWKKGLVTGLLHRCFLVCSSWNLFDAEIDNAKLLLRKCGYPISFVNKITKDFVSNKQSNDSRTEKSESTKKLENFFQIPYIGYPSIMLSKKLKKIFADAFIDITITFKSKKLGSYFSLKDRSPMLLQSGVVYKFSCQVDPGCSYIGKTSRHLFRRISEHKKINSQISPHLYSCLNCKTTFESCFSTIDQSSSGFSLSILEALYIKENAPNLNKQLYNSGSSFLLNIFT